MYHQQRGGGLAYLVPSLTAYLEQDITTRRTSTWSYSTKAHGIGFQHLLYSPKVHVREILLTYKAYDESEPLFLSFTLAAIASLSQVWKSWNGSLGTVASSNPSAEYSLRRSATDLVGKEKEDDDDDDDDILLVEEDCCRKGLLQGWEDVLCEKKADTVGRWWWENQQAILLTTPGTTAAAVTAGDLLVRRFRDRSNM